MLGQDRKLVMIVAALVCAIVFGIGFKTAEVVSREKLEPAVVTAPKQTEETEKPRTVTVHVTGAVKNPGVFTFPEGARIIDGVNKADPVKEAELAGINLAEVMKDQQQIFVPGKGDVNVKRGQLESITGAGSRGGGVVTGGGGRVNINTADAQALDSLPGIGPSFARKIIDYRNQNGGFKDVQELLKVPGIGEKKLAELKERVTI